LKATSTISSPVIARTAEGALAQRRNLFVTEWTQHTELIAFGVREYDPGTVAGLSDVHASSAETGESLHFGELIARSQIKVQAVLHGTVFRNQQEEEIGNHAVFARARGWFKGYLVRFGKGDTPTEHLGPEFGEPRGIEAVDTDALHANSHLVTLGSESITTRASVARVVVLQELLRT
jgi:hypothetical protein